MRSLLFYIFYAWAMKIYHRDKDYEKARIYYEKAGVFLPFHAKNHFKIAMCFYKLKEYALADESFEKALELNPKNEQWQEQAQRNRSFLTSIFLPQKLWWKNIIDLEALIEKKGGSFAIYEELSTSLKMMNRFSEAAAAYEKALKLCSKEELKSELCYEKGFCYEKAGAKDLAKKAYENAIKLETKEEVKQEALLYGIGVFHELKERWVLANKAFLEKAKDKPGYGIFCKLANSFARLYEWERAQEYYKKALELNFQEAQTHFNLALAYEREEKFCEAVASYEEALKRSSNFKMNWHYRLGLCLNKLGEKEKALQAFLAMQRIGALAYEGGGIYDFEEQEL